MAAPSKKESLSVRQRVLQRGRRRVQSSLLDDRVTRGLLSLLLSVGIVVGLARAPLPSEPGRVGWSLRTSNESISLHLPSPEEDDDEPETDEGSSTFEATAYIDPRQPPEENEPQEEASVTEEAGETDTTTVDPDEQETGTLEAPLEIFELSGHEPNVSGGMGSLYMHVDYPLEARQQGIEGRVILTFVVDENGTTHDIRVMDSAHPILDSAAVRAVERTRFVPGEHEGEPVAVRMRLPIRFQLVASDGK